MTIRIIFFICLGAAGGTGFAADVKPASLETLEGLVKTWTGLRKEISAEQREWQSQKTYLEAEQRLLEKEISLLNAELKDFEDLKNVREEQVREQVRRKEQLQKSFQEMEPVLDRMEAYLLQVLSGLPGALRGRIDYRPKNRTVDRVQSIISAFMALEDLQHGVHPTREILVDQTGNRREMEVVYLGLARAFAVSSTNDWAGVGIPDARGWQWSARPELAPQIRKLVLILNQEQAAEFVDLPFQIMDAGEVKP